MILNIFSCPEIIWSWFIPLDLPVVNLSGAMPQAQHLIMEFASRFDWVCVCFGSFSLCSPFMGQKCDQHHTIKSGQSCLLPQQSDATCSCVLFQILALSLLLAGSLSLVAQGKGNLCPPFPRGSQTLMRLPRAAAACGQRWSIRSPALTGERSAQRQHGQKLCLI